MSRQPKTLMVAYTDFDRPFATAPGVPPERVEILREASGKCSPTPAS
jgi:hypothetical protein